MSVNFRYLLEGTEHTRPFSICYCNYLGIWAGKMALGQLLYTALLPCHYQGTIDISEDYQISVGPCGGPPVGIVCSSKASNPKADRSDVHPSARNDWAADDCGPALKQICQAPCNLSNLVKTHHRISGQCWAPGTSDMLNIYRRYLKVPTDWSATKQDLAQQMTADWWYRSRLCVPKHHGMII